MRGVGGVRPALQARLQEVTQCMESIEQIEQQRQHVGTDQQAQDSATSTPQDSGITPFDVQLAAKLGLATTLMIKITQHLDSRRVLLPSPWVPGPNGPNQNTSRIQIL